MIELLNSAIIPYKGLKTVAFGTTLDNIKSCLKDNKVPFLQTMDSNKGCQIEIPWIYITIEDSITLCFVKGILFEIVLENKFRGKLPNGGCIGMNLTELEKVDPTLTYNDDEEDYTSKEGYWVEDDIDTGVIKSITIFVSEVLNEEFFDYTWVNKYV